MNNNYYAVEDFVETMNGANIKKSDIKRVVKVWGDSNGSSKQMSGSELTFGAVVELKDGRFAYAEGWNDYTGWGCQDGVEVRFADTIEGLNLPKTQEFSKDDIIWEDEPIDLNRWVWGEIKTLYERD